MSPLPGNELHAVLAPSQVLLARRAWSLAGGRLRRRLIAPACVDCAPPAPGGPAWGGALAVLGEQLRQARRGARLHVTLSNRLVRYALVPWQPRLRGAAETAAYALDCLRQSYGAAADGWDIRVSAGQAGRVRVASAIDRALLEGLRALCADRQLALAALRPQLAGVLGHCRRQLRAGCGWLLLHESDCLCMALFEDGAWRALRSMKAGPGWERALDALLERETWLAAPAREVEQVFLWAPGRDAAAPGAGRWPLRQLAGAAPPGSAAWYAARFGLGSAA